MKSLTYKSTLWITTTAIFIALLVGTQAITASFGQLVTGSLVNLILIVSVMTCGLSSGVVVAIVSPVFATLFNVGPVWGLVPFIIAGNITIILVWHFICKINFSNIYIVRVITIVLAALCKSVVLYFGVVQIAIPMVLKLPEPKASVMSSMFSFPQLFTALIGGALAFAILPVLFKAIPSLRKSN